MRLSIDEQRHIHAAVSSVITIPFELRLYGSRADDSLRGGDIDLLLLISDASLEKTRLLKPELLVEIKERIGEQRIDLTLCSNESIKNSAFLSSIYPNSIPIDL